MNPAVLRLLAALSLAGLAATARAEEPPAAIRDDAGLFHAEASAQAETKIADLRRNFERNLFVRTVSTIATKEQKLPWLFRPRRVVHRLLQEQANTFADETGAEGIYVLICRKPRGVHVLVRPSPDPRFGRRDAEALRKSIARNLTEEGADQALLDLVAQTRTAIQTNEARGSSTSVVSEFTLVGLLGGGGVLWLLLWMVRYRMRAGSAFEEDPAEAVRRPALLGAMFGFPAGGWIYDRLHPYPSGAAAPLAVLEPPPPQPVEVGEPTEERIEDAPVSPG